MILVAGLPASGKSTWARMNFRHVLEFDSFAEKLGSYEDLEEERGLVLRQFALLAGLGGCEAVVDVFHSAEARKKILDACPSAGIVIIDTPLEICLQRNAQRNSFVSNKEIEVIAANIEPISADEGFSFVKIVKGW